MRGTGYAIGEILIFLAIAAIIGFLIGWLVFYRRPDRRGEELSPANPNHVRRLEERARTADAKVIRIEQRANLLLESLSRATVPQAPVAADLDQEEAVPVAAPSASEEAPAEATQSTRAEDAEEASAAVPAEEPDTPESPPAESEAGDEGVDEYLSEADDRISKLEETLDKLSEKLAELEED